MKGNVEWSGNIIFLYSRSDYIVDNSNEYAPELVCDQQTNNGSKLWLWFSLVPKTGFKSCVVCSIGVLTWKCLLNLMASNAHLKSSSTSPWSSPCSQLSITQITPLVSLSDSQETIMRNSHQFLSHKTSASLPNDAKWDGRRNETKASLHIKPHTVVHRVWREDWRGWSCSPCDHLRQDGGKELQHIAWHKHRCLPNGTVWNNGTSYTKLRGRSSQWLCR